jgi:hypothetical protein
VNRRTIRLVHKAPIPDMTGAACGTEEGRKVMDRVHERTDSWNVTRARELCADCPIKRQCAAWVLSAEVVPGSWGGVYGGLSPKDRKDEREGVAA